MSIHITRKGIRATGKRDASQLLISMAPDETLLRWARENTQDPEFVSYVKEAIAARRLKLPDDPAPTPTNSIEKGQVSNV